MPVSDTQFAIWAANDEVERVVAVQLDRVEEVSGAPATLTDYASNLGYTDPSTGQAYPDALQSAPTLTRSLGGDNFTTYSSTYGTLDYANPNGEYDFLLGSAIDGSEARVYLGDPSWDFSDFRLVFTGIAVRATAPDTTKVSVEVKDAGVLLDKSIGGTVLVGGSGASSDKARPLNFGAVRQVECILLDAGTLTYVHSDTGTNTSATTVRDNGASVGFSDNADGTSTLLDSPAGMITADVMALPDDATLGDTTARKVSDAMRVFVGERCGLTAAGKYSGAHASFVVGDSDDYLLGFSIEDQKNVLSDFLPNLCDSGNCFFAFTRGNQFSFGRIRPDGIAGLGLTAMVMTDDDVDVTTIKVDHTAPKYYQFQGYMNKNWSQVSNLAFALPPDEVAVLTRNGLYSKQPDSVGTTYADAPEKYHLSLAVSPSIETWLSNDFGPDDKTPLDSWMDTRRSMNLPWLETVTFSASIEFYTIELGDAINLSASCYGLDSGALFQVTQLVLRPTDGKMDLTAVRRRPAQ